MTKKYVHIIFLQNTQDFDSFSGSGGTDIDGFFDSTVDEMISYLSQWDYGDSGISNDIPSHGTADTVYINEDKNYILSYNSTMGYAGLERIE